MAEIVFHVQGIPAPQGSKNAYPRSGKVHLVESSKTLKPWRDQVAVLARHHNPNPAPMDGPMRVHLHFVMPRPKSTPKTRPTPPAVKKPDLDKLVRAVCDALTQAGVWRDDSQMVDLHTTKRIAEVDESPGVHVRVCPQEPRASPSAA
jgi:crossover junction endodeoxyribonuclease RusA